MRVEEEWWCSVVFNILQQFLLSSCGTTTSKIKWKSKNSEKKKGAECHTAWRYLILIRSTSPSIHWKSGRPNILSQNNALFGKKKNRHRDWAWPLPQFSSQTGVSKTRGRGRGLFFLENAVLWLGLFRDRVRFRFRIRVRVSVNPNPNPKTAFFKKKIDPNPSFYWHPSQTESWIFICPFIRILEPLHVHIVHVASISNWSSHRAVANIMILSCRVYATNMRGIVQQGSSFCLIVLLFPIGVAGDQAYGSRGKSPVPGSWWQPCRSQCVLTCGVNHTWRRTSASLNYERFVVTK